VTDVIMPGMNGRTLSDRLLARWPDLRVLFVSGYTDVEIAPHGIFDPGVSLLSKPYTPELLQSRVRQILDRQP